jgi:hypothetical protein
MNILSTPSILLRLYNVVKQVAQTNGFIHYPKLTLTIQQMSDIEIERSIDMMICFLEGPEEYHLAILNSQ